MVTRSPRRAAAQKIVLALCLIIVIAWIIVAITVSAQYDYDIWNGSFDSFNVFTAIAATCASISYGIYRTMPSARSKVASFFNKIPRAWNRLIDSGITPYFNPDYYTIVNGVYRRQVNPNIAVDSVGLPIVDHNVPLTSFDIDIYKQYYRLGDINMKKNKQITIKQCLADSSITSLYEWQDLVGKFYDITQEQLRVNTIGEACWIVEPWHRKPLLIHKSNYISFIKNDMRDSGWETSILETAANARYEVGKVTGLHWLLNVAIKPSLGDNLSAPNRHIYMPIYKELWAIANLSMNDPTEAKAAALTALYNFATDPTNSLGYPILNRTFMDVMIRSVVIRQLPQMISRVSQLIESETIITSAEFYNKLTDPIITNSTITFKAVIAAIRPDADLTAVLTVIQSLEHSTIDAMSAFTNNMNNPPKSIIPEGTLVECIRISRLVPYLKKEYPDVWKAIRVHNNAIMSKSNRRKCATYISKNILSQSMFTNVQPMDFMNDDDLSVMEARHRVLAMDDTKTVNPVDRPDMAQLEQKEIGDISKDIETTKKFLLTPNISSDEKTTAEQRLSEFQSKADNLSTRRTLRTRQIAAMAKIGEMGKYANKLLTRLRILPLTPRIVNQSRRNYRRPSRKQRPVKRHLLLF
jgi:hypothetical protein